MSPFQLWSQCLEPCDSQPGAQSWSLHPSSEEEMGKLQSYMEKGPNVTAACLRAAGGPGKANPGW